MDIAFGSESSLERRRGEESYLFEAVAPGVTLLAVADGFGSLGNGLPGAPHALSLVRDYLRRVARSGAFAGTMMNTAVLQQTVVSALGHANSQIFARSGSTDDFIAGGIAIVAALVVGRHAFIAHVGDARMYLVRNERIEMLTFDDAVTIDEVPSPALAMPGAAALPRNLLWRSLGTQARLEAGVSQIELFAEDRLLLCTSGLHRRLAIEDLSDAIMPASSAADALGALWTAQHAQGDAGGAAIIAYDPAAAAPYHTQFVSQQRRLRPTLFAVLAIGVSIGILLMLRAIHPTP